MPRLSDLTDYDPMGSAVPVELPVDKPFKDLKKVYITGEEDLPVKFSDEPVKGDSGSFSNNVDKILNSLFRPDEKRLQLWPEKLLRSGTTAAGNVMSGEIPQWAVDPKTGDVHTSPQMVEAAQEMSALAGTGGLGGTGKARLATKELEKVDTNPLPKEFARGTKDDTGIWFLEGDKPIYAQAKRDSLDKLYGDRAKEFDNFKSVSDVNSKNQPISVWYREGHKETALKEIENFKKKVDATKPDEQAKLHYESGVNLGYPEEAARAYAYKRFGVDPAPGGEVVLGATPSLRPALKYKDKLYKGKPGQEHMDVIPESMYPDFQKKAMNGDDIKEYNFGFVNDKGHFLSREDALKYGIDNGLIDPQAGKFGALTSTLFTDSSKPGAAIEAMKTAKPDWSMAKSIDQNLKGDVAKALDTWVGGPHNSLETGFGGGVWHPDKLKAVLKNPELNAELEASIKPFKDDLRSKYGDSVELYRYHGKLPKDAKPDRELLSFTSDPSVTDKMAQIQPPKKSFTDTDIAAKEKEFAEKGEVKIGRYTLKKNEYGSLDIDDPSVGGFLTDTPSVSEWMKELNGYAKDHNSAQADKSKLIYKKKIPIDDIVYATDRFGQQEFIVKNKNKDLFSKPPVLPPGYELKPVEFNPFELKS